MKKTILCLLCVAIMLGICGCKTIENPLDDDLNTDFMGNYITNLDGVSYGMLAEANNLIYYHNYAKVGENERYSGLYENNCKGTARKLLYNDCGGMINVYDGKVYFRNYDFNKVLSYDLKSGKITTLLSDYFVQYILVYQEYIYFIHMDFENNRKCTLYQCDLDGKNVKLCAQDMLPYYLDVAGNQLFYIKYNNETNIETLYSLVETKETALYSWEYQENISVKALKDFFVILSGDTLTRFAYDKTVLDTQKAEEGKMFSSLAYNGSLYYIVSDVESGYQVVYQYLPGEESKKIESVSNGLLLVDADSIYACGWEGEIERLILSEADITKTKIEP